MSNDLHPGTGPGRDDPQPSIPRRLRFLITPRWIALEIAVIAFTLACYFLLAPWQFSRSSEHDARTEAIATAMAAPPISVSELLSTTAPPPDGARWRRVSATGHFDADNQSYVRLRHDNAGRAAYEVLVPFVTTDGTVLLTDRGYVSFVAVRENKVDLPPLADGQVTITGRVQQNQIDPKHRPPTTTPDGRTAYTAASSTVLEGQYDAVYQGYVQLAAESPGAAQAIELPADNSRPFFSYAIQWLSFGVIAILGLGYFIYREFTDPVDGEIYVAAGDRNDDDPGHDPGDAPGGDDAGSDPDRGDPTGAGDEAEPSRGRRGRFDKSQLYDAR